MADAPSIFVAVPCSLTGGYRPFDVNLAQFLKQTPSAEVCYGMTGVVPGARNRLVREALKAQDEYVRQGGKAEDHRIWWLDDDQPFSLADFGTLLAHNLDAVVPLSLRRGPPFLPLLYDGIDDDYHARQHFMRDHERGLIEVAGGGMAGLLIRTDCFRKMGADGWFEFVHPPENFDDYSEDLPFYKKLAAAGIPLYCDLETRFGHAVSSVAWPTRQHGVWVTILATDQPYVGIPQLKNPLGLDAYGSNVSDNFHGLTLKRQLTTQ